jgi:hypothetical protein
LARYWYGWWMFARAIWIVRRKRHGSGKMKWRYALRIAACVRHIVDGQYCNRPPRWVTWARKVADRLAVVRVTL